MKGLLLTVLSMALWAAQPIGIAMIKTIPYTTLAFYKISSAAFSVVIFLVMTGRLPTRALLNKKNLTPLLIAAVGLSASYLTFNSSFQFVSPSNVQVYFQLSRLFMALAGVFIFKEVFIKAQWLGLVFVVLGLATFYRDQVPTDGMSASYLQGVTLVIVSAATWAVYAIFQKIGMAHISPLQSLAIIYVVCTLLLSPYAEIAPFYIMSSTEWLALVFICMSNVLAFSCFSEAIKHWEASKIGTLSCLTPLGTMALMFVAVAIHLPLLQPENLGILSLLAALLSIFGSVLVLRFSAA